MFFNSLANNHYTKELKSSKQQVSLKLGLTIIFSILSTECYSKPLPQFKPRKSTHLQGFSRHDQRNGYRKLTLELSQCHRIPRFFPRDHSTSQSQNLQPKKMKNKKRENKKSQKMSRTRAALTLVPNKKTQSLPANLTGFTE